MVYLNTVAVNCSFRSRLARIGHDDVSSAIAAPVTAATSQVK